jgi:hypothetical protein
MRRDRTREISGYSTSERIGVGKGEGKGGGWGEKVEGRRRAAIQVFTSEAII